MNTYQCHKKVLAFEIHRIERRDSGTYAVGFGAEAKLPVDFIIQRAPQVGEWLVMDYDDPSIMDTMDGATFTDSFSLVGGVPTGKLPNEGGPDVIAHGDAALRTAVDPVATPTDYHPLDAEQIKALQSKGLSLPPGTPMPT